MPFKINPLSGELELVSIEDENFSFNYIETNCDIEVPEYQQMIVYDALTVDGILNINGEVIVIDDKVLSRIYTTGETESVNVEVYEVIKQTTSGIVTSLSDVIEGSKITIVNSSSGTNTLNITIQGEVSPIIYSRESFSIVYNGTDWDIQ